MNEQGIKAIKEHLENGNWREIEKIRGVLYNDPKLFVSYCIGRIERKEGGQRQLEALYHHAASITMHFQGMTEKEINDFWWGKLREKTYKNNHHEKNKSKKT